MAEQKEEHFELIDRNKNRMLQQKRMNTIKEVAGLLGIQELKWIYTEIHNMIEDIERKNNGK
tara:strand:+ start:666 stop:851 length:186 start_codon:yes stop_codon:yes gene_type:complete